MPKSFDGNGQVNFNDIIIELKIAVFQLVVRIHINYGFFIVIG